MYDVSLIKCEGYAPDKVYTALLSALEAVNGLDWVRPGVRAVIKANLVSAMPPDRAATTHPELLCALTRILREKGVDVTIGDSPGGLYNHGYVNRIYSVTGIKATEKFGAVLNQDFSQKFAENPEGRVLKNFMYTGYLDGADVIIDFCKLKSHGMMGMSAAAKNMFGAIPGTVKPEYHFRFPDYDDFADMIVDIDEFFRPVISIVDGIVGMEGNGPTAGTPREMGFIGASQSPHMLDMVCAELLGLDMGAVPTLSAAARRGLIPESVKDVKTNADISEFAVENFRHTAVRRSLLFSGTGKNPAMRAFSAFAGRALRSTPRVRKAECVGCGVCAGICPAGAITMENRHAKINRDKCICCFCCQEFCPKGAMRVHRPVIARIAGGM